MVLDAVANFVRGSTDAAVDATQTTVSVDDASIFPDPSADGEFNVVIWDATNFPRPDQDSDVEILRVTARDTGADELAVTRAQEVTAAAAHPSGSAVHLSPTAKMFGDIEGTFADFWDANAQELTADVNNQSVNTGQTITDPPADGVTKTTEIVEYGDQRLTAEYSQRTLNVSTTAKEILSTEDSDLARGVFAFVTGSDVTNSGVVFADYVIFARNGSAATVGTAQSNGPSTRTYGVNGSNLTLEIGSGTYDVYTTAIGARSG